MAKGKKSGASRKKSGQSKKSGEGKQQRASRGARRRGAGQGGNIFGSIWKGLKKVAAPVGNILWNDVAKPALQGTKIISNTLSKVPVVGNVAADFARQRGFGRGRSMHGAGMSIRH